jgi:peptidoglycan/xylan/chitin deacetylase (PgdA/CDA1 family)
MSDGSVLILNWHGIGPPQRPLEPGEDLTWVDTARFESILDVVVQRADIQLTFDDGNASDIEIALPRLTQRGLSAQFFVLAGRVGERGLVDEAGLRKLVEAGMDIGSHGWAHRDWRSTPTAALDDEIDRAPRVLAEMVGRPVDAVAVPFGSYDRKVLRRLRRSAVRRVYTSDGGRTDPDRWMLSRFSIRHDTTPAHVRALLDARPGYARRTAQSAKLWAKRNRMDPLRNIRHVR